MTTMKWKRIALAAALVLALGFAAWLGERRMSERRFAPKSASRETEALLPSFLPERVRRIETTYSDAKATLTFDDGYWSVAELDGAQADTRLIANFLDSLSRMRPIREIPAGDEEALFDLHLAERARPDSNPPQGDGILTRLFDENGNELFRCMFGYGHEKVESANTERRAYDGRYVRIWNDGASRVFLVPTVFAECRPDPNAWTERLRIVDAPLLFMGFRQKTNDGRWRKAWSVQPGKDGFVLMPNGEPAAVASVASKISQLTTPFSVALYRGKEKIQFPCDVSFSFANGFSYRLEMAPTDSYPLGRLTVSYEPDKVKREDGETDDAYEARKKYLAGRFDYEKRVADGRIFFLRPGVFEKLILRPERKADVP